MTDRERLHSTHFSDSHEHVFRALQTQQDTSERDHTDSTCALIASGHSPRTRQNPQQPQSQATSDLLHPALSICTFHFRRVRSDPTLPTTNILDEKRQHKAETTNTGFQTASPTLTSDPTPGTHGHPSPDLPASVRTVRGGRYVQMSPAILHACPASQAALCLAGARRPCGIDRVHRAGHILSRVVIAARRRRGC